MEHLGQAAREVVALVKAAGAKSADVDEGRLRLPAVLVTPGTITMNRLDEGYEVEWTCYVLAHDARPMVALDQLGELFATIRGPLGVASAQASRLTLASIGEVPCLTFRFTTSIMED